MNQEGFLKIAQRVRWFINEALFPRRCLSCRAWGKWCCQRCLATLSYPRQLYCPSCHTPNPLGEFCPDCAGGHWLNGLWTIHSYHNPLLRKLIYNLKYELVKEVAPLLGQILTTTLQTYQLPPAWHKLARADWRLIAVPLAARRLRERGFNQAELLAQTVAQSIDLPLANIIRRRRYTKPQSKINLAERRRQNIKNAFVLTAGADCRNQAYIIIDDVYTSGATLEECARLLKQAGAVEIWGLTVAKG